MSRKDINLSFKKHPITRDITSLKDESAVEQSIKNIVLTSFNEIKRNPSFGTNIKAQLFNIASPIVAQVLKNDISNALKQYEPDIDLLAVGVTEYNYETINCIVVYTILTDPTEYTTQISLPV